MYIASRPHVGELYPFFPRDLYVTSRQGKDKINAAFAYGGAPLLVQTVQGLVGVPVDHVAIIDFEGFKQMTDAVGGVNVYVEESSAGSGYTFTKGYQQMGGTEVLAFVRERKELSEGDISAVGASRRSSRPSCSSR